MNIIGIVLSFVGFAYLCWLLFVLAVHALPFFAGVTVGLATYHSGSGPVAAIIIAAGYHAARGLAQLVVPAEAWRETIAIAGATIVAATAFMRMWLSSPPNAEQGVAAGPPSPHLPASQTSEA